MGYYDGFTYQYVERVLMGVTHAEARKALCQAYDSSWEPFSLM